MGGAGLRGVRPVRLERWFASHRRPPRFDLARSGAPPRSTADLLQAAGSAAAEEYLSLPLDYGDGAGTERLRAAIVAAGGARSESEILITHGAIEGILLLCAAALSDRGGAAVGMPAYEGLVRAPEAVGASVVPIPVWTPESAYLDLSRIVTDLPPWAGAVILNSPHNPTGAIANPDQVTALAEKCLRDGPVLIIDEVARSTLDPAATSFAQSAAFAAGAMAVVGDVSKAFGLGGLRVGWVTSARADLLQRAAAIKDVTSLANAAPSEFLAALALEKRSELLREVIVAATLNRAALGRWIAAIAGAECSTPMDGLLAFPHVPLAESSAAFATRLRTRAEVGVVPGSLFGFDSRLRLGLGNRPDVFAEGLERLRDAIEEPLR